MDEVEDISISDVFKKAEKKNEEFSGLLDKVKYASNETKKIWREIYQNAVDDRSQAFLLFVDLYRHVANKEKGHVDHGKTLAMYLERMNRSNDQLLRLAELIEASAEDDDKIDADALYAEFDDK